MQCPSAVRLEYHTYSAGWATSDKGLRAGFSHRLKHSIICIISIISAIWYKWPDLLCRAMFIRLSRKGQVYWQGIRTNMWIKLKFVKASGVRFPFQPWPSCRAYLPYPFWAEKGVHALQDSCDWVDWLPSDASCVSCVVWADEFTMFQFTLKLHPYTNLLQRVLMGRTDESSDQENAWLVHPRQSTHGQSTS